MQLTNSDAAIDMDTELEKNAISYAEGYADVGYDDDQIASVRDAFIDGAKWQKKQVWHSANEEPDPSRLLCVCCANFRDKIIVIDEYKPKEQRFYYEDGEHYDYVSLVHKGLKWAYIEDLLPEQL